LEKIVKLAKKNFFKKSENSKIFPTKKILVNFSTLQKNFKAILPQ
jgi:hypothetical protein